MNRSVKIGFAGNPESEGRIWTISRRRRAVRRYSVLNRQNKWSGGRCTGRRLWPLIPKRRLFGGRLRVEGALSQPCSERYTERGTPLINTFTFFTVGNCSAVSSICACTRGLSHTPPVTSRPAKLSLAMPRRTETLTSFNSDWYNALYNSGLEP